MSRLLESYNNQIRQDLKNKLGLKNLFEVPKLNKIILNMGVGEGKDDSKLIDKALEDLLLFGQKQLRQNLEKQFQVLK